jgi:DNA-binding NarL/FixJ family response regulator
MSTLAHLPPTPRMQEYMTLAAQGMTDAEIAAKVGVKPTTVAYSLQEYRARMGFVSRATIAVAAACDAPEEETTHKLTPAQRKVLRAMVKGLSVRKSAESLHVSESTIRWHRQEIRKSFGVNTTLKACIIAIRQGLV